MECIAEHVSFLIWLEMMLLIEWVVGSGGKVSRVRIECGVGFTCESKRIYFVNYNSRCKVSLWFGHCKLSLAHCLSCLVCDFSLREHSCRIDLGPPYFIKRDGKEKSPSTRDDLGCESHHITCGEQLQT